MQKAIFENIIIHGQFEKLNRLCDQRRMFQETIFLFSFGFHHRKRTEGQTFLKRSFEHHSISIQPRFLSMFCQNKCYEMDIFANK